MKISIFNTHDITGGASRAAYRLHKGLQEIGFKTNMLVRHKKSKDDSIVQVIPRESTYSGEKKIFNAVQRYFIEENRTEISNTLFSFPYPGYDISNTDIIRNSDIINLHWIHYFQSVETISNLLNTGKPVIWTLHDQGSFTGGCHYTAGCKKYESDCKNCPQLDFKTVDIPYSVLNNKINNYFEKDFVIVTPSQWLASCARNSRLFSRLRIEVIPYSIETDIYKPMPKQTAKNHLGLNPESKVLLFGAHLDEKRKGFEKLFESLQILSDRIRVKDSVIKNQIHLLCVGDFKDIPPDLPFPLTNLGYIDSDDKLAVVYSAADIFLLPSLEDNFPNTILESMACGTPVVGFNIGGIPDVVKDNYNGYAIEPFNIAEFAKAIEKLIFDDKKRYLMSTTCRNFIKKNYRLEIQAKRYANLFSDIAINNSSECNNDKVETAPEIPVDNWKSNLHSEFNELYRIAAANVILEKEEELRKVIKELVQEKHELKVELIERSDQLANIYNSYSYKWGRLLTYFPRLIKSKLFK
jgi:glycosyltransferase involved in cell wall biosynthesis